MLNYTMDSLKKRTTNFSPAETDLLISLVNKYKIVIECMKTDTVSLRMKKDAWIKIQDEYNGQSIENPRTAVELKNKYDNVKRNVKKQYADEKTFNMGSGGGPTKTFLRSSIANTVGEILQTRMTSESPVYDSDYCEPDEYESAPGTSTLKREWTNYTPIDLKSRSKLTTNNSTSVDKGNHTSKKQKIYQDKISSWASTRASLSEQQQSAFIEQQKLKMDMMCEKHTLEKKMMSEKHQIEIENLLLQKEILLLQKQKLL